MKKKKTAIVWLQTDAVDFSLPYLQPPIIQASNEAKKIVALEEKTDNNV